MSSAWPIVHLEDVVTLQRGHDLAATARTDGPVPVIGSGGIAGWHDEAKSQGPGVVLGRATNLGRPQWSAGPYWPLNTTLYVTDFKGNNPRFVFHLFESLDLSGFDSGSVQPMLNRNYIARVPVALPPLAEQHRIAEVLGALDDLVEVNHQLMNSLRQRITSAYEKALLVGATEKLLFEVFEVDFGGAFRGANFTSHGMGLPLLRIRDLKTFSPETWTTERLKGDVLVESGDVVVGMDAEFRSTLWLGSEALLNQRVCRIRPMVGSLAFVREAMVAPLAFIEGHKTGTTVSHLNKADLLETRVLIPREDALAEFDQVADPMRLAIVHLYKEIQQLRQTRDELLPLLMSGAVKVTEGGR